MDDHASLPVEQAMLPWWVAQRRATPNHCVCSQCRPKGMSLRDARLAVHPLIEIQKYGEERAAEREQAKVARLAALKERE